MIIITNPHFSQYRVSRDSLPTQLSNLAQIPMGFEKSRVEMIYRMLSIAKMLLERHLLNAHVLFTVVSMEQVNKKCCLENLKSTIFLTA